MIAHGDRGHRKRSVTMPMETEFEFDELAGICPGVTTEIAAVTLVIVNVQVESFSRTERYASAGRQQSACTDSSRVVQRMRHNHPR